MIKYCGCKTGSNLTKSNGQVTIANLYHNSRAITFQDNRYGKGYRIQTPLKSNKGWKTRCTTCGKES